MSNGSTILQTFPGFIALVVAGGALTIAFKVAGGIEGIKVSKLWNLVINWRHIIQSAIQNKNSFKM